MPAQVTTRAQVNGYRFLIRRLEHALIRADSRMIHDPMRGQIRSLVVGMVIAVLITGACGVLAFFKPSPNMGDAQILLSKSTGGLFVRIGDRIHPVLNVASARMITGKADQPKAVDDKWLNRVPRGPMVGIVGAPTSIHGGADMTKSSWTVCDNMTTPDVTRGGMASLETTVLANDPVLGGATRKANPQEVVLTRSGDALFLIYNGVKAPINPRDAIVITALHLDHAPIRTVSPGLLNAFPPVPPIHAVRIEGAGEITKVVPATYRVGAIVRTHDSKGEQLYVVLRDGLQPISEATADIIRYGDPDDSGETRDISPALLSSTPVVDELKVDYYPTRSPEVVKPEPDRVVCMAWQRANTAAVATVTLLVGHRLPLPEDARAVRLATADGDGPGLDSVYLKPGTGEYVQATDIEPDSRAMGQLFYVSDTGQRYHIKDLKTAAALGVTGIKDPDHDNTDMPQFAPWSVLGLLPAGPELSQEAALVAHDGMAADPKASALPQSTTAGGG